MTDAEGPLISVATPRYEHERFVAKSLNGEFTQTHLPLDIDDEDDCSQQRLAFTIAAPGERPDQSHARLFGSWASGSSISPMLSICRSFEIDR